jgi:hypothetical protein
MYICFNDKALTHVVMESEISLSNGTTNLELVAQSVQKFSNPLYLSVFLNLFDLRETEVQNDDIIFYIVR